MAFGLQNRLRALGTLPRVVGHRGAKLVAPENTLAGLRAAKEAGATWVEFDVKLTSDGVAILMHDETLERTTSGQGLVAETPWSVISGLDAGVKLAPQFAGERVPSFEAAIMELGRLGLGANVEIKPCPGRERETARIAVDLIHRRWPTFLPAPLVSSFKPESLEAARNADHDLALGWLAGKVEPGWQAQADRYGCITVHLGQRDLTAEAIAEVRATGRPLLVWTVNDRAQADMFMAAGAASIITDDPASLRGI